MSDRYKGGILSPTAPTVIPQSAGGVYTLSQQLQYQGQGVWPPAVNYPITKSLRFRSSASAYLNRTPASAGNRQTWTWSGWVKRGTLGTYQQIFGAYIGSGTTDTNYFEISFSSSDLISITGYSTVYRRSTAVYRDPSAWYHIIVAVDTTQATAGNRLKVYVNGSEVTAFDASNNPTQNTNLGINGAYPHGIGAIPANVSYFDGYMAEVNFIDGQALTPSSFGTTDAYGIWQPIPYSGTYGTNGFYLPFTNTTSTSTLGNDFSGNSNTWTVNNISLTSGSTYDSMTDVPTLTSATVANYCVLNPLVTSSGTISNGNLQVVTGNATSTTLGSIQIPTTGKWYFEYVGTSNGNYCYCGVSDVTNTNSLAYYANDGNKYVNGTGSAYGATYTNNDVIGVAVNSDSGTVTFYKNNTSQGAITYTISDKQLFAYFADGSGGVSSTISVNFGQQPFTYTPPSGFYPLNTYNLPTPTILDGDQYFNAVTYTGAGAGTVITTGFYPDFAWMKNRTAAFSNFVQDSVRGGSLYLLTDTTDADATISPSSTFSSTGITINGLSSYASNSSYNYVLWAWKANAGTNVSNTQGTITSTVSANTTAGFSIVTYTGSGASATVGHGLGVAPSMIIIKNRGSAQSWRTYHTSVGVNAYLLLDSTAASASDSGWTGTSSTTFTVGGSGAQYNASSNTYVAYCFSAVAGYSAFGSYTGNASTDGPFVYLGFRPRFILIRRTDAAGGWKIYNTSGLNYNPINTSLETNDAAAEATSTSFNMDWLSNGFKIRTTYVDFNASGSTYIYACFAENPFKIANAR